ncbi:hypothetical protein V5O48_013486 [Marasmius crinis-equi]|uniref:Uncharacterized protein n=1 Tax=Marasmius crinis-equi TaxID=585013 RepID=A0ABR3EZZ7_9AGAR
MPTHSRLFGQFPNQAYPSSPPITLHQIDELEKHLIRKELRYELEKKIENVAGLQGFRDRRHGDGHLWTAWRVSYGVNHWPNVGRLYRKCLALGHWRNHYPCVSRPRFMTDRLRHEQLEEIEERRALYDALGPNKWSLTSNPGGSAQTERARWIRFLWRQREHPSLETLGAVFWRLLDHPTDEGLESTRWNTDSDGESASWIVAEPDSDPELDRFVQRDNDEPESEDNNTLDQLEDNKDVKEPAILVGAD